MDANDGSGLPFTLIAYEDSESHGFAFDETFRPSVPFTKGIIVHLRNNRIARSVEAFKSMYRPSLLLNIWRRSRDPTHFTVII